MKTLNNTTADQAKDQVSDIQFWGDGNAWRLLGKASSKNEGWMKSSKAYEIEGVGCVVQVTTQQINRTAIQLIERKKDGGDGYEKPVDTFTSSVAEAVTFVPGVKIEETFENNICTSRKLVQI